MFPTAADLDSFDFQQINFNDTDDKKLQEIADKSIVISGKLGVAEIRTFLQIGALCEEEKARNGKLKKGQKQLSLFKRHSLTADHRRKCVRHFQRCQRYPVLAYLGGYWHDYARAGHEDFELIIETVRNIFSDDAELFPVAEPAAPRRKRKTMAELQRRSDAKIVILAPENERCERCFVKFSEIYERFGGGFPDPTLIGQLEGGGTFLAALHEHRSKLSDTARMTLSKRAEGLMCVEQGCSVCAHRCCAGLTVSGEFYCRQHKPTSRRRAKKQRTDESGKDGAGSDHESEAAGDSEGESEAGDENNAATDGNESEDGDGDEVATDGGEVATEEFSVKRSRDEASDDGNASKKAKHDANNDERASSALAADGSAAASASLIRWTSMPPLPPQLQWKAMPPPLPKRCLHCLKVRSFR